VFDNWIETLLSGQYGLSAPQLHIVQGGTPRFQGSGHISWQSGSDIRITATTDGADEFRREFGLAVAPGQLIPLDRYISARGLTHYGYEFESIPVPSDGSQVSGLPNVSWDFRTHGLTLTHKEEEHGPETRTIRILLSPPPRLWIRASETGRGNEHFESPGPTLDWMIASTSFGSVAGRQRSDRWFEVKVCIDRAPVRDDPDAILAAVCRGFGFILGRRVINRGYIDSSATREIRHLNTRGREPTRNHIPEPLGNSVTQVAYLRHVESLLGLAVDFFMTELGDVVSPHLALCWDSADNDYRSRQLVVSICLEGLVQVASRRTAAPDGGYTTSDRAALDHWLKASQAELSPRFYKRVKSFLAALDHRRPKDILWDWVNRGILATSSEDIDAWEKTRHPAAHGQLIQWPTDRVVLQQNATRLNRVYNVINRIVLQLMGFQGSYVDYSAEGWPTVPFPAARPEDL
jgi:hypothetical protein